jgi:hypothetical protein
VLHQFSNAAESHVGFGPVAVAMFEYFAMAEASAFQFFVCVCMKRQ